MHNIPTSSSFCDAPASQVLPLRQYLARFNLYLMVEPSDDSVYAKLLGPTFPFDHLLVASGACWHPNGEFWAFSTAQALEEFAHALRQDPGQVTTGLAEDSPPFVGAHGSATPLERFLTFGPNAIQNQELLELLLSFDPYLADPGATSRRLFHEFGSLGAILGSEPTRLAGLDDITPRIRGLLKAIQLTIERVLHEPVQENPVIGSWQALLDYLKGRLRHRQREEMLILYLNKNNCLIKTEHTQGSIDHVPLYPRDVAAKALELFAHAIIVAHNHPGGSTEPSKADIEMTIQLNTALKALKIELYDHVIVAKLSVFSFKDKGII